jgi:hypothetical protein
MVIMGLSSESVTIGVIIVGSLAYLQYYRSPYIIYHYYSRFRHAVLHPPMLKFEFCDVDENVMLGSMPDSYSAIKSQLAEARGVSTIISCQEPHELPSNIFFNLHDLGITHVQRGTPDFTPMPLKDLGFCVALMLRLTEQKKKIYIHCRAGQGRSGTLAVCYYCIKHNVSI